MSASTWSRALLGVGLMAAGCGWWWRLEPTPQAGLRDPRPEVRRNAIRAVADLGARGAWAVPILIPMISEKKLSHRAVWALGEIGAAAEPAVDALVSAVDGAGGILLMRIALALGKIAPNDARVAAVLKPLLSSPYGMVRVSARGHVP